MQEKASNVPDVSVIIPVYNVAPYIRECAESLFNQTLQNIEYIFIDDASTDDSIKILNQVISKHPDRKSQIKIISHQQNKGTSYTRQEGIDLSTGKWVIHCDSDDYLEPEAYSLMVNKATETEADIVICDYRRFAEDGRSQIIRHGEGYIDSLELLKNITGASETVWHGSLWNRIIRRELLQNIQFLEKISYCEDVVFLVELLINNPNLRIIRLPYTGYNYRMRSNSITTSDYSHKEKEIICVIDFLENLRDQQNQSYQEAINSKILSLLYSLLNNTKDLEILAHRYRAYKNKIGVNKELNILKKMFLNYALKEKTSLSKIIRGFNREGLKGLKYFKKKLKKI